MKIGIITFHNTSNFGATLQCSALSRYLRSKGHRVAVINYLPQYILNKKSAFREFRKVKTSSNKAKALIKGAAYLSHYRELKRRDDKFELFINDNLDLTKVYPTFESLLADPPKADFFICGSDQIWNPVLTGNELDKSFFLQFTDGRKMAYGASIGEMNVREYSDELATLTQSFSGISVREESSAAVLKDALKRDINVVLDCTLLLDKDDYTSMEAPVRLPEKPYVVLYNIQNSSESVSIVQKLSADKNLTIVDLSPNPFVKIGGAEKHLDIGPGEFLTYIKNADFVVTNSFHGTVFSVIYEKPFFTIPHKTRSNRTVDLLRSLNLESRLTKPADDIAYNEIDYKKVSQLLTGRRLGSFQYIDKILSEN